MLESPIPPNLEFDLLVLGAGPAGLSAAKSALDRKLRVLMIDSGNRFLSLDEDYENRKSVVVGGIGGTAKVWGGQCGPADGRRSRE